MSPIKIRLAFIAAAALSLVFSLPSPVFSAKTVAVLLSRSSSPYLEALSGFRDRMDELGVDAAIKVYDLDGDRAQGREAMAGIKGSDADMILSVGSTATEVAYVEAGATPVVFMMVSDPQGKRFIAGYGSSKNNLTGVALDVPADRQLGELKRIVPRLKRVGVMFDPVYSRAMVDDARANAALIGIEMVPAEVSSPGDVPDALIRLKGKVDAIWSIADDTVFGRSSDWYIINFCLRNKIPFMGLSPYFVENGALISVSADHRDIGKSAAELAAKVISGTAPSKLKILRPAKLVTAMNMNTARAIGLKPDVRITEGYDRVIK